MQIPQVLISTSQNVSNLIYQKYVLIQVINKESPYYAIVSTNKNHHEFIVNDVTDKFPNSKFKIHGGGRIKIDHDRRTIHISDRSVDYGKANHKLASDILGQQEEYKDYQITFEQ